MADKRPAVHPGCASLGAYDPCGDFGDEPQIATDHLFLPWQDVDLEHLAAADRYASARGRKILISIEPWSWVPGRSVSPAELRDAILAGQHDADMRAILDTVASFESPVVIRWAQEMDDTTTVRYPWSSWEPADYIAAYRRMAGITRDILPTAKIMWSPKGEPNLADYYPGDDYVDVVGLSVFGLEDYDRIELGAPRSFRQAVRQGYELSVGFGKPIWIAELGYEGGLEYVSNWVREATACHPEYPELKEVVYFNAREVWPWPHDLGLPDWRVAREQPNYTVRRR
jgi:endoglucanase